MDTPETSALVAADWPRIDDDDVAASAYWRMVELARELERERNELRKLKCDVGNCPWVSPRIAPQP